MGRNPLKPVFMLARAAFQSHVSDAAFLQPQVFFFRADRFQAPSSHMPPDTYKKNIQNQFFKSHHIFFLSCKLIYP